MKAEAATTRRPNFLVVLCDQLRKDSLGCYGNPVCRTPNLDRLAESGTRFTRNYVANQICMPNRLSIFTGQNIRNHGLWTNGLLLEERRTLPAWLAGHGYRTANIGKIHFTPYGGSGGNAESYDAWESGRVNAAWTGPYWGFEHVELTLAHYGEWFRGRGGTDEMLERHAVEAGGDSGVRSIPPELHDANFVAERSIEYLRNAQQAEAPFFLVASFPDPHHPFDPPEEVAQGYDPAEVVMPAGGAEDLATRPEHYLQHFRGAWGRSGLHKARHPEGVAEVVTRERIAHTYAMVDLIDRGFGRIVDFLKESALADNTVVIFTSDHGELLGDHGLWYKGPFYYEGLISTPLLLAGPGVGAGRVSGELFSALDIAPTVCDLAGVPQLPFVDGISQRPHLEDPGCRVRDACLVEYRNGHGSKDVSSKCLVREDLKYVRYQTGEEELTDLAGDPQEGRNLAAEADRREQRDAMRAELIDAVLSSESKGPEQIAPYG